MLIRSEVEIKLVCTDCGNELEEYSFDSRKEECKVYPCSRCIPEIEAVPEPWLVKQESEIKLTDDSFRGALIELLLRYDKCDDAYKTADQIVRGLEPCQIMNATPEPCLVKEDETDPWVWCPGDPAKVKMPCKARFFGLMQGYIAPNKAKTLIHIEGHADPLYVDEENHCRWDACKVRKSSLVVEDDYINKPSLWWYQMEEGYTSLNTHFCTRNELLRDLSNYLGKIKCFQPYNQESQFGPIESKWETIS